MKFLYEKYIATFIDSLLEESKSKEVIRSKSKASSILNSGWGRIPNIKDLQIKLGSFNKIFKLQGMDIREDTNIKFLALKPDRMNRFIIYQLWTLSRLREKDPEKYFKLAFLLIKRSVSFRVSAINHVFKGWYKEMPLWVLLRINRKTDNLIRSRTALLDFERVYIPKGGSDKVRPLGVPSPEWRLYLHMVNNMMHWYLRDTMLPTQHGFIPGRGTLTAWKDIFQSGWIERDYIYECDLKQFFPSIKLNYLNRTLLDYKVPETVVNWLYQLNSCIPRIKGGISDLTEAQLEAANKLAAKEKVEEDEKWKDPISSIIQNLRPLHLKPAKGQVLTGLSPLTRLGEGDPNPVKRIESVEPGFFKKNPESPRGKITIGDVIEFNGIPITITGKLDKAPKAELMSNDPAVPYYNSNTGVPQGAPTSPFLSITTLKPFLTQQDSISYADDPIFFGDSPFKIQDDPENGIVLNTEKSGWVKWAGQWQKPLRFLGLEFDGKELYANTRNGSRLLLSQDIRNCIHAINELEHEMWKDKNKESGFHTSKERVLDNWYNLFKSRLIGHLVSRMYIGEWNLEDYKQDFTLKFVSTSWLDIKWSNLKAEKFYTIFNASSYASWSLAEILRHRYKSKSRKPSQEKFTPMSPSQGDITFGREIHNNMLGNGNK